MAMAPWIIDGTLIPMHDQSISAPSKICRHSINTQIIICARSRQVIAIGQCWPGNRNNVVVARHTLTHLLAGGHQILGDGGYRGIPSITTPRCDKPGRVTRDHHWRHHRRIHARVEHVIARLKDWQSFVNAVAAATPSTTAFKSSQDSGTSKATAKYGSTLSASVRFRTASRACRVRKRTVATSP